MTATPQVRRAARAWAPTLTPTPKQRAGRGETGAALPGPPRLRPPPRAGAPRTLAMAPFWSRLYKPRRRFQGAAPTLEEASLRSPVEGSGHWGPTAKGGGPA